MEKDSPDNPNKPLWSAMEDLEGALSFGPSAAIGFTSSWSQETHSAHNSGATVNVLRNPGRISLSDTEPF